MKLTNCLWCPRMAREYLPCDSETEKRDIKKHSDRLGREEVAGNWKWSGGEKWRPHNGRTQLL